MNLCRRKTLKSNRLPMMVAALAAGTRLHRERICQSHRGLAARDGLAVLSGGIPWQSEQVVNRSVRPPPEKGAGAAGSRREQVRPKT